MGVRDVEDVETVKSIVRAWCKEHGYDGLCGSYCGCDLDELMPCDGPQDSCEPALKADCASCKHGPDHEGGCEYNESESEYMMFVGGVRCDYEKAGDE